MPTISENLLAIDQIRRQIRNNLLAKGVSVPPGTGFESYPGKVDEIPAAVVPEPPTDSDVWERPTDWLPVPEPLTNELYILVAVSELAVNTVNLTLVGNYTIDWGDGTSVSSNAGTQTKTYDYNSPLLIGTETDDGKYRQVIIRLTSTDLTTLDLSNPVSPRTYSVAFILEIKGRLPNCSTLRLTKNSLTLGQLMPLLEHVDLEIGVLGALTIGRLFAVQRLRLIVTNVSIAIPTGAFSNLHRVKTIELNTSMLFRLNTNQATMFSDCWNLRTFTFEPNSLLGTTSLGTWFRRCYSLKTCVFGPGNIPMVSNFNNMFENCFELKTFTFPDSSLTRPFTTLSATFFNCNTLSSVAFPTNSMLSVSTIANMFNSCFSIETIAFPSGAFSTQDVSMAISFFNCRSLRSIVFASPVRVSDISQAFSYCHALRALHFGASPTTISTQPSNAFQDTFSLEEITGLNITRSFRIDQGSKLTGAALNALYAGLPVVSGQTIAIYDNIGIYDPIHDPSIATSKGWIILQ